MPTITFREDFSGFSLASSSFSFNLQEAPLISTSASRIVFSASGVNDDAVTVFGTGLEYTVRSGQLRDVTGGTVTGVAYTDGVNITLFEMTGLGISAADFYDFYMDGNSRALDALLFSTSDTYDLSDLRDTARGFGGNDRMFGKGGDDRLFGDDGNDRVIGGSGNDTLTGGRGADTLAGNTGKDVFVFTSSAGADRDIVSDFRPVDDALQFDDAAFTGLSYTGRLKAGDFVGGTAAKDGSDRFVYEKSSGKLWFDGDGSGARSKVLVAELPDGTALTNDDIFII